MIVNIYALIQVIANQSSPSAPAVIWNSADKNAGITLSLDDTGAERTSGGDWASLRAAAGSSDTKYVVEFYSATASDILFGFADNTATLLDSGNYIGRGVADAGLSGGYHIVGSVYGNASAGVTAVDIHPAGASGYYMLAVDPVAGKAWMKKSNSWFRGDPETGADPSWSWTPGSIIYPAASLQTGVAVINGDIDTMTQTVPAGFVGL